MKLNRTYIDHVITTALDEDVNYYDVTTGLIIPEESESDAVFIAKTDGVLCGIDIALRVFDIVGDGVSSEVFFHDGDTLKKGDIIANIHGKTSDILTGERTALNILQMLSGTATATASLAAKISHTKARLADTRKTVPGLRALQKYAVLTGGGTNHRFNLSDAALIKDNHIDACGSIAAAVNAVRAKGGHMLKIEVEVRSLDELQQALDASADVIMLDNMSLDEMKKAVAVNNGRALLEASGNINGEAIKAVAETGVDIISCGALTHSVTAMDISLKIKR